MWRECCDAFVRAAATPPARRGLAPPPMDAPNADVEVVTAGWLLVTEASRHIEASRGARGGSSGSALARGSGASGLTRGVMRVDGAAGAVCCKSLERRLAARAASST